SLARKAALLREAVLHALETLLAKRQGSPAGQELNAPAIRGMLQKAEDDLREAQERSREWTRVTPALLALVLEEGARRVLAQGSLDEGEDPPLLAATRAILRERDRAAQEVAAGLRRALFDNLESLCQLAPSPGSTPPR